MLRQNENEHSPSHQTSNATVGTQNAAQVAADMAHLDHPFSAWLDADLARLEKRFAHYATPNSRRRGLPKR